MFHHHRGWLNSRLSSIRAVAKLPHHGESSFEIQQIVRAQFLTLQLNRTAPTLLGMAEPTSFLMRVLAIAEGLTQRDCLKPR